VQIYVNGRGEGRRFDVCLRKMRVEGKRGKMVVDEIIKNYRISGERYICLHNNSNSVALVRERTLLTERPPLVGEVSANFCG
jgi:hypothetical protein